LNEKRECRDLAFEKEGKENTIFNAMETNCNSSSSGGEAVVAAEQFVPHKGRPERRGEEGRMAMNCAAKSKVKRQMTACDCV
jgi:hypothetical protein